MFLLMPDLIRDLAHRQMAREWFAQGLNRNRFWVEMTMPLLYVVKGLCFEWLKISKGSVDFSYTVEMQHVRNQENDRTTKP